MLRVVGCITQDHDPGLVALACLVCILAANTSVRLLRPRHDGGARAIGTCAAVLAFGTGVWTTHFIGMLAFRPNLPVSFNVPLCLLSLLVSLAATAAAFWLSSRGRSPIISGLVLAVGIGAMHFAGMRSLIVPGVIHYDPDLVIASLVLGALSAIAAMTLLAHRSPGWASVFLTLAVAFTFALTLLSAQLMVALFCLAWITVFAIAITHNSKS